MSVSQGTRGIPTQDVSRENVMRIQTVVPRRLARTTSVLIPVPYPVVRELIVVSRTMWLSVGVLEEPLGIHSGTAGDSPGRRFALLVELTLTVRLDKTTGRSAVARIPTLGTPYKDVATNVIQTLNVVNHRHATDRVIDVRVHAKEESVEKMQTVKQSTIGLSAPVLLTSLEIHSLGVTRSAPDTLIVKPTRLVSGSNVEILVRNQTPMCAGRVLTVKQPTIRRSVPVLEASQEIHL